MTLALIFFIVTWLTCCRGFWLSSLWRDLHNDEGSDFLHCDGTYMMTRSMTFFIQCDDYLHDDKGYNFLHKFDVYFKDDEVSDFLHALFHCLIQHFKHLTLLWRHFIVTCTLTVRMKCPKAWPKCTILSQFCVLPKSGLRRWIKVGIANLSILCNASDRVQSRFRFVIKEA